MSHHPKVRFSLHGAENGELVAHPMDVAIAPITGRDLVDLRRKVAVTVEAHFGGPRPISLLVGGRPRRATSVRSARPTQPAHSAQPAQAATEADQQRSNVA